MHQDGENPTPVAQGAETKHRHWVEPAMPGERCDDPVALAKEFHLCRLRRRLTLPKIARSIMTRNAPTQIGGQSGS